MHLRKKNERRQKQEHIQKYGHYQVLKTHIAADGPTLLQWRCTQSCAGTSRNLNIEKDKLSSESSFTYYSVWDMDHLPSCTRQTLKAPKGATIPNTNTDKKVVIINYMSWSWAASYPFLPMENVDWKLWRQCVRANRILRRQPEWPEANCQCRSQSR